MHEPVQQLTWRYRYGEPMLVVTSWDGHKRSQRLEPFERPHYGYVFADDVSKVTQVIEDAEWGASIELVPRNEAVAYDDRTVARVDFEVPTSAKKLRDSLLALNIPALEMDVEPGQRVFIDKQLRTPADQRVGYYDIETDPSVKSAIKDLKTPKMRQLSYALTDGKNDRRFECFDDELDLMHAQSEDLAEFSCVGSWSDFDYRFVPNRCKVLGYPVGLLEIEGLDMMSGYVKVYMHQSSGGLGSFVGLAEAAKALDVPYTEMGVKGDIMKVLEYFNGGEAGRKKLGEYNMQDVDLLAHIDNRVHITQAWTLLAQTLNVFCGNIIFATRVFNQYTMDIARSRSPAIICPTRAKYEPNNKKSKRKQSEKAAGGHVFPASPGLHYWVLVLDFKSLYPSIMRSFNIGLDTMRPLGSIVAANGAHFVASPRALMNEALDKLQLIRKKYDEALVGVAPETNEYIALNTPKMAVKTLNAAASGVCGTSAFRLYNKDVFEAITKTGQDVIQYMARYAYTRGYGVVIYGDTDSMFIELTRDYSAEEIQALVEDLNAELQAYVIHKYHVSNFSMELEADRYYSKLYMTHAKKRYAGVVIREGVKDVTYVHIVGFEIKRRDWTTLAKYVQEKGLSEILGVRASGSKIRMSTGDAFKLEEIQQHSMADVIEHMRGFMVDIKRKLYAGEYDEQIIIGKGLSMAPDEYKSNVPQVVVARMLQARGLINQQRGTDVVYYMVVDVVKRKAVYEPVVSGMPRPKLTEKAYDWYWKHQILPILDRLALLAAVGQPDRDDDSKPSTLSDYLHARRMIWKGMR